MPLARPRQRARSPLPAVVLVGVAAFLGVAPGPGAETRDAPSALERPLIDRGFENVRIVEAGGRWEVRFENRIERWELPAIGEVARTVLEALDSTGPGPPAASTAGRLALTPLTRGVPIVTLEADRDDWRAFLAGTLDEPEFRERLAIGRPGPLPAEAEAGGAWNSSRFRVDAALRPLAELQLGIADNPFQTAFWVAPELTVSPATGLLLTLQARVEVQDEFDEFVAPIHPGRNTLSLGLALPGGIDLAASGGYFPEYRYGFGAEAGRFLDRGGYLEARVGGDYSGFLKVLDAGTTSYSDPGAWSGVGTLIARAPGRDIELAAQAGHFYSGDVGVRVDLLRRFGEVDLGLFGIATDEGEVAGVRFNMPLPVRRAGRPRSFRPTTVPAFPFEYREDVGAIGLRLRTFDNLDRFRRGLVPTAIRNNLGALRGRPAPRWSRLTSGGSRAILEPRPGLGGMTGLLHVPTAHVTPEGGLHAGYMHHDRSYAYEGRGTLDNRVYFVNVGLLPYLEATLRATVTPGEYLIEDVPVDAADRMFSVRAQSPWPGRGPVLAAGMDDIRGTRRFHSLYVVATQGFEFDFTPLAAEITCGFGLRTLTAPRYLLDGVFGGVQLRATPWAVGLAEYDSEKWSGGVRLMLYSRLSMTVALLDFEKLSGGAAWTHHF
jgi:hypothetical protein